MAKIAENEIQGAVNTITQGTEITIGVPKPPLRIIAPRGAPTKKNIKQAKDKVNFF